MHETSGVKRPPIDLEKLTTDQKLDLIRRLWDSLEETDVRLSREQRQEIERRAAQYERTGDPGVPWPVVRDRLLKRRR